MFVGACAGQAVDDGAPTEDRGPIGKADLFGSCEADDGDDHCGGKSDGNCWCDDLCVDFGDCCGDVEDVCGGDDGDDGADDGEQCGDVLCALFCEHGFKTDENGCEVCECNEQPCGGFLGLPCDEGFVCVDFPGDDCDPQNGGADCGGICVPARPRPAARAPAEAMQARAGATTCAPSTGTAATTTKRSARTTAAPRAASKRAPRARCA